jgi:DHA1 family multidrug resistance protein-like MFS transporter
MSWRVTFWSMVTIQAVSAGAFSISLPFLPLFIEQLGVHPLSKVEEWSGILGSINFLTAALCAPIWGAMADKFGRKAMVIRSSIFGSIATLLMGLSGNVWQLLATRAFNGVFGGFSSAATALVAAVVPSSSLGFALGWMATAQQTGIMIGPVFGGLIADNTAQNYRLVYFVSAGFVGLVAVITALFVRETFERKPRSEKMPSSRRQLLEIARHPELAPLLVVLALTQVTAMAVSPIVSLFVRDMIGGASPYIATFAGASFAVMGIGDLVASPWLGKRSDDMGYRRIVLICLVGAGAFTIPQAFVHNVWAFLALRFGVGLFIGGIIPTANAWIGRLFPAENRGMVYGLSYSASFAGMFIGPLFGGFLAARLGFGSVFLVTGGLMLANVLWVLFGVRPADPTRDWR